MLLKKSTATNLIDLQAEINNMENSTGQSDDVVMKTTGKASNAGLQDLNIDSFFN